MFWKRRIPFLIILAILGMAVLFILHSRGHNSPRISAQGGEVFHNFPALKTPIFLQEDVRWKNEKVGGSGEKLGAVGCTVCSLAMALNHFGITLTPKELNDAIKTHEGYTWRGLLKWDVISAISGGKVTVEVAAVPSHAQIDTALRNGEPVLAKILVHNNSPHWVLIVGKEGTDYLIRDPLGNGGALEPLTKYDSDIFGIRIIKLNLKTRG